MLVASVNGAPSGLALGATVAEMQTTSGNWLVPIPGPSTVVGVPAGTELTIPGEAYRDDNGAIPETDPGQAPSTTPPSTGPTEEGEG